MANIFSEKPIVEIVAVPGRDGTDIPIDDVLSNTSENPVQNKVVKQAIDNAVSVTEDFATQAVEAAYGQLDEAKQDVLDDSGAGQNIKTINGESILGTGNLEVGSQIDVDDALNPTSENPVQNRTLYQAFNELNSAVTDTVYRLANREYGYTHEAIVTYDLENDYNLIINGGYQRLYNPPIDWNTEYASYYYLDDTIYRLNTSATWDWNVEYYKRYTPNSDLANVSAVGMLAVLNHGVYTAVPTQPDDWAANYDKYFYLTSEGYIFNTDSTWNPNRSYYSYSGDAVRTQGNRLFINGEESDGYTFRGVNSQNGIEVVKIWYFEKDNTLELNRISGFVNEIIVNNSGTSATFSSDFFDYANEIISNAPIPYTPIGVRKQKFTDATASHRVSSVIEVYESNAINLPNGWESLYSRQMLKKAVFPNLTSISNNSSTRRFFNDCISLIDLSFPLLEYIGDSTYYYFGGVHTLTLPESLLTIGGKITTNNKNIILNCKNATSISDNWCNSAPTESFVMCADWGASINIAVAASGWAPERFTTIPAVRNPTDTYYLYNLLKQVDYVPTTHTIKISSRYVTDDLVDAYLEIGWDLVGM